MSACGGAEVSDKLMHAVLNNEWRYWYAPLRDDYGMTPLHIAALCNSKEAVEFFLEQGLDPEKKATESRYKAVTYAAIGGKQENLNLLMQGENAFQNGPGARPAVLEVGNLCSVFSRKAISRQNGIVIQPIRIVPRVCFRNY